MTVEKNESSPSSWPLLLFLLRVHVLFGAPPLKIRELLQQLCEKRSTN